MMRLFPHDDPGHRDAFELLPWYANGSLAAQEHARVEAHVAECLACKRELQQLRGLREALLDEEDLPARHALNQLMERIDCEDGRWRWQGFLGGLRRPGTVHWVMVAVVLAAIVIPLAAPMFNPATYRTLSAAPATPAAADVLVIFDPARSERDIRGQLLAMRADIVGGPTAEGVYSLALAGRDREAAIRRLRGSGMVLLAEPAYHAAAR